MWSLAPLFAIHYNMTDKEKKYYKSATIAILLGILLFSIGALI